MATLGGQLKRRSLGDAVSSRDHTVLVELHELDDHGDRSLHRCYVSACISVLTRVYNIIGTICLIPVEHGKYSP